MTILYGLAVILITVMLHALATTALIGALGRKRFPLGKAYRSLVVALTTCFLALKHSADIVIWGFVFWYLGGESVGRLEDAIYFSSVTYTTLGYGDIVLSGQARFLCSIEAINGMILFGWSTAILLVLVEKLWIKDGQKEEQDFGKA